jgi:hypothetical protein
MGGNKTFNEHAILQAFLAPKKFIFETNVKNNRLELVIVLFWADSFCKLEKGFAPFLGM